MSHRAAPSVILLIALSMTLLVALPTANASAEEAGRVVLSGQVTDENGTPLEGAVVVARTARSYHGRGVDQLADEEPPVGAEAVTDARGIYRLAVDAGVYELIARADGRAARRFDLQPVAEPFRLETVALPEAVTFRLRVLTADGDPGAGSPAVGVQVAAQADVGPRAWRVWHPLLQRARTDANGRATFPISRGLPVGLRMVAADGSFFHRDRIEGGSAEVALERGAEWTIRAEDPRGSPVPGLVVQLTQARIAVGRTDEDGRFPVRLKKQPGVTLRLSGDDGTYLRTALADGLADTPADAPENAQAATDDSEKIHVVTLEDPQTFSGQVLDAESGECVAGALVWAAGLEAEATITDRAGGFTLTPRSGTEWFRSTAAGYLPNHVDLREESRRASSGDGDPEDNPSGEPVIRLLPSTRLDGRVVDAAGRGIAGAQIDAEARPGAQSIRLRSGAGRLASTVSDDDGTFRLHGLVAGMPYLLQARRRGFARVSTRTVAAKPPQIAEIELTLEAGIRAVGRIVDESGAPLAGATAELFSPPPADPRPMGYSRTSSEPLVSASSAPDGLVALADVGSGSYRLEVRRPGFARAVIPGVEIGDETVFEVVIEESGTVAGGTVREADLGEVVMVPGVTLEGVVVDDADRPVAGVSVVGTPESRTLTFSGPHRRDPALMQTTGADGRFRLVDLTPEDSLTVHLSRSGYAEVRLNGVEAPTEEPLRIVLDRTAKLRGRVVDENGAPLAAVHVTANPDPSMGSAHRSPQGHAETDERGRFEIEETAPGSLRLRLGSPRWKLIEEPLVDVGPGETIEGLELRATANAVFIGRVVRSDGRPAPGSQVEVRWHSERGAYTISTSVDEEGRFTLSHDIRPGSADVEASHPEYGMAKESVELTELGGQVELRLRPGIAVAGQVVSPYGEPVVAAEVELQSVVDMGQGQTRIRHQSALSTSTDADGRFWLRNVAEGTWTLFVQHEEFAAHRSDPFETAGGSVPDHFIRLSAGATLTGRLIGVEFDQLASANVVAYSGSARRWAQIRHDASYRITGLAPGSWLVQGSLGDTERQAQLELEEGDAEATLDLDFSGGYELVGSVRLDGEPVDQVGISLFQISGPSSSDGVSPGRSRSNYRGEFRIDGLEAGRYQVNVSFSWHNLSHHDVVDIPYSGRLDVDIRTSSVQGVVRSANGAPLAEAIVEAIKITGFDEEDGTDGGSDDGTGIVRRMGMFSPRTSRPTYADGVYRMANLQEGTWRLVARRDGYVQQEIVIQAVPGADLSAVDFLLEPDG